MRELWIIAALAIGLAGCGGGTTYVYSPAPARHTAARASVGRTTGIVYASVAPPRPLVEVAPPRPGPGYAWINGHWRWNGSRYVWRRGRWGASPGPGYAWQPNGWVRSGARYRFVPGRWYRGRAPNVPYVYATPRVRHGRRYAAIPPRGAPYAYDRVPPRARYRY